jgi:hypothetical protein
MRRLIATAAIAAASLLALNTSSAAPPGRDGAFNFRFGAFVPTGNIDFWQENEKKFTLDHSDFNAGIGGVGYTASIGNYVEFDVNADYYNKSIRSAHREFVDENGDLILHDSRLSILPVTVGFRVLPAGRYARRGAEGRRYVRRPVPYFGAGIGMAYWEYEEMGDFVFDDPTGPTIFFDRLKDSGLEFEKHVLVGIEFPVAPEWNITLEVRKSWAEATPSDAFPSLTSSPPDPGGKLDLGGASAYVGASLRF